MRAEGQANRLSQAGDARAHVRVRVRVRVRGRVRVHVCACVCMCAGCSSTRLLACKRLVRLFELREGRLLFLIWRAGTVGPLMQPRDERHRLGHARLGIRGCLGG